MSASLAPECNEVKERYDTCFLKWYSESKTARRERASNDLDSPSSEYLRGGEKDSKECDELFQVYRKCLDVIAALNLHCVAQALTLSFQIALKKRGIDKLVDEAREDNKENDARLTAPKS
ncbi:hypothetical protein L249_0056 [Ophiocordyceps polyrhachis-furcata BCC 54312]|uniref:Uncharacterized protein n=1 Tax=Ophiocordyceps polyrhachis-furcata BCC 54312 TaxID=1330021 RepID=A0A367LFA5_9HYPO|nr:hypothetical protein L249_0056 [Ophiocordyceps polyrhachis-furcata BCC 54312]